MRAGPLLLLLVAACATPGDPMSYRLAETGSHWSDGEGAEVLAEGRERYPEFFDVLLDPSVVREFDTRPLRDDLERSPVDRRNFDALHAVAIAYFELNYRAESDRGGGLYLGNSMLAAQLVAVPWRAYSEVQDPRLRGAILDFFEDAGTGEKIGSAGTAPRLARVVGSLAKKEPDPARHARIEALAARLQPGFD